jgi:hypothetical protein
VIEEFDSLTVRFTPSGPHRYAVRVTTSDREASGFFAIPFPDELDGTISALAEPPTRRFESPKSATARELGHTLFDALFQGTVRDVYIRSLDATPEDRGLRITLCLSEAPELMRIPWEYLFHEHHYVALSAGTPIVRYLDLPSPPRPLAVEGPLRVLGVISNPCTTPELDAAAEQAGIERALADRVTSGLAVIEWVEPPTLGQLAHRLGEGEFHVLHFICHGKFVDEARGGVLAFEKDDGGEDPVSGDRLGEILYGHDSLRLVVLNACEGGECDREDQFAGVATSLVQREIPAVIAMQFEITNTAATLFAGELYGSLARGRPVDAALVEARRAIFALRESVEFGTPVLFMRTRNGRLFDLSPAPPVEPPTPPPPPAPPIPPERPIPAGPPVPVSWRAASAIAAGAAVALAAGLVVPAALHASSPDRFPTGSPYYGAFSRIPGHLPDVLTETAPGLVVLILLLAALWLPTPKRRDLAYGLLAGAGAAGVLIFGEVVAQAATKPGATISWWDGLLVGVSALAALTGAVALPGAVRGNSLQRLLAPTVVAASAAVAALIAATTLPFNGFHDRKVITDSAWNLLPTAGIPLLAAMIAALAFAAWARPVVAAGGVLALGVCSVGVWLRFFGVPIVMMTSERSSDFEGAGPGAGAWLGLIASVALVASGASLRRRSSGAERVC